MITGPRPGRLNGSQRAAMRLILAAPDAGWQGDGTSVPCVHGCGRILWTGGKTPDTRIELDRIQPGGTYELSNLQPACRKCNAARGTDTTWTLGR